jgi:SAM-dependent methyltransferase
MKAGARTSQRHVAARPQPRRQRPQILAPRAGRFDIPVDQATLARISDDARSNGGILAPSKQWQLDDTATSSLSVLLEALLGPIGMQPVDAAAVRCYESFLRGIDHLGLCEPNLLVQGSVARWTKSDLGTLMDVNLTTAFLRTPLPDRLNVCEVGGGYGRVAEAFLQLYPEGLHYVLIDAVPATLMYAYAYLRAAFPGRRIGSLYAGDEYDPSFDCFVMPAWRSDLLPDGMAELAMNIESLQEMDAKQVAYFMAFFERVTNPLGTLYISNARDYVYKGDWPYPRHWEVLYQHNTPRSWSRNHPTLVMRKGVGDYTAERRAHEAAFDLEMARWDPGLNMMTSSRPLDPAPA